MMDKATGGDIPNMNDGTIDGAAFALGDILEREIATETAIDTEAGVATRGDDGKFAKRQPDAEQKPAEKEAKPDEKAEAKAAEPSDDDEDDYFEIEEPGEDGQPKPVRVKVSDVWDGYQSAKQLKVELEQAKKAQPLPEEQERALSQLVTEMQQYQRALDEWQQWAPVPAPSTNMVNPAHPEYDPEGYYRQLTQHQSATKRMAEVRAERERVEQLQRQHNETLANQRHQRERSKVLELMPELKEKATADKFKADLIKNYGFTEAEIASVQDHRFYVLAKHALSNISREAAAKEAVKVVRSKPKLIRASAKGHQTAAQARAFEASGRLSKSGSIEDAVDAIAALI